MTKTKLIPFDLELARQGAKIVCVHMNPNTEFIFLEFHNNPDRVSFAFKPPTAHFWETETINVQCLKLEVEVKTEKVWVVISKKLEPNGKYYNKAVAFLEKPEEVKMFEFDKNYTLHEIEREV